MSAIDNQALAWLRLQSERELDADERAALDAWLDEDVRHRGAYIRAHVVRHVVDKTVAYQASRPGEDRYGLRSYELEENRKDRRSIFKYGALAAGIGLLGISLFPKLRNDETTLATVKGEMKRVALPDTSVASINSASKLEVKLTSDKRQIVLLKGEAWFEVAKDKSKPFIVEAGDVRVRAVGTAFSMHRLDEGVEVLVTEGTVEVWTGSAKARLNAGQRSFVPYRTARITVDQQPQEVQRKLAWRDGMLIFTRQTLDEAIADFNRYSTRKIILIDPALGGRRIFGQYPIDAPEQFAKDIGSYLNVPIEINADFIAIGARHAQENA